MSLAFNRKGHAATSTSTAKRAATGAVLTAALVAGSAFGAFAAFSDNSSRSEDARAGMVQLTVGQGVVDGVRTPSSSTAQIGPDGYVGSSYVGEVSRTTYANYAGPGRPMLPPTFELSFDIDEASAAQQLDDYTALHVQVRENDCNLGAQNEPGNLFLDTFLVGELVDADRLAAVGLTEADVLRGFTHSWTREDLPALDTPTNGKICVITQLAVLDADNPAMGDTLSISKVVDVFESDTSTFVFRDNG